MALVGRLLEAQGFRVGIISPARLALGRGLQARWASRTCSSASPPATWIRWSTATPPTAASAATTPTRPTATPDKRPDRAVIVYAQRCREAFPDAPLVIGGIEASLRRIAHYDYWSDKVRRSVLLDAKADLLLFGNAERALVEIAHRLAGGETIKAIRDLRGTAFMVPRGWRPDGWTEVDSTTVDTPGAIHARPDPYAMVQQAPATAAVATTTHAIRFHGREEQLAARRQARAQTVIRLPSYEQVSDDPVLYAHASRMLHLESNPGNARALVQRARRPRGLAQSAADPADHRGDGRTSTTCPTRARRIRAYGEREDPRLGDDPLLGEHHARLLRRLHLLLDHRARGPHHPEPLGRRRSCARSRRSATRRRASPASSPTSAGPTANMYRMACKDPKIESACRAPVLRLSRHLPEPQHRPRAADRRCTARRARCPGVKKVLIASGLRYDLAVRVARIREGTRHPPRRRLPQDRARAHRAEGPLSKMMKPGIGSYDRFKAAVRQVLAARRARNST